MEREQLDLQDYVAILKRRIWAFIIPAVLVIAVGVPVIFMLPPKFESKATVLVEDQAIPSTLVQSTVNSYAAERLKVITKRVMATQNLIELINKLDLYRERRGRETMTELAEQVRENFGMDLIEANVARPQGGQIRATIAFTLSFRYPNAQKAQTVVNELVSLYISENLRSRRRKAEETTNFLQQEIQKTAEQISSLEKTVARFKKENAGNLPEQTEITRSALRRAEQELLGVQRRIDVLRERKIYLEAQIIQVDPMVRPTPVGSKTDILDPEQRLRKLQSELISLRARYGPRHPDVMRIVRQIAAVSKQVPEKPASELKTAALAKEALAKAKSELAAAQERYSDAHPDVIRLKRRVAELEEAAAKLAKSATPGDGDKAANNPAYIRLKADLLATQTELTSLAERAEALRKRMVLLESRVQKAPEIERVYTLLRRRLDFAIGTHKELSNKLRQARLGEVLETERMGERFALLEPASLAPEPVSPNRPAYVLVAFMFAFAFGAASAAGKEALDKSVHGPKQLATMLGEPPLVVLPTIVTEKQQRLRRLRKWIIAGSLAVLVLVIIYLVAVQQVLGPLDILQARIENKLFPILRNLGLN